MVQSYSPGGDNVSFREGTLAPPGEYDWTCASFRSLKSTTQTANRSVQPFLHISRQKLPIFYNGRPYPPELLLPMGDLDPRAIHGSLILPESSTQTASRSLLPFLQASLVRQTDSPTDRLTDHATRPVTIGRMYVLSTAMRCNNTTWLMWDMAKPHTRFTHWLLTSSLHC